MKKFFFKQTCPNVSNFEAIAYQSFLQNKGRYKKLEIFFLFLYAISEKKVNSYIKGQGVHFLVLKIMAIEIFSETKQDTIQFNRQKNFNF